MRVLIVDDDPNCRQILELMLSRIGLTLTLAVNGAEGVHMAKAMRPDLILMDILMPELSGLDAVALIKADPDLAGTPVIAVTALAFEEERRAALAAGYDHVVTKPFSRRQLLEAIERYLPGAGEAADAVVA